MGTSFCSECHRPLSEEIDGVRLPKFKSKLFRFIDSHPGQSSAELADRLYGSSSSAGSIRSHLYQINELFLNTGVRIRGNQFTGYFIERGNGA